MAKETKNSLVEVHDKLEKLLSAKREAMPKNFNQTRFLQNCMTVLQDTKDIERMNPVSVARTMLKGAFLGLDFFNKECYAIAYADQLTFQTDYKGEIKLAKKYSMHPIQDIYAKLVRKGDVFEESIIDGRQSINFKPLPFNNADIIGAFAVCYFKDGSMLYEAMSTDEIEKIKSNYSRKNQKGEYSKAWRLSSGEMYKKTVLRRLTKLIELEFDSVEQKKEYDKASEMDFEEQFEPVKMPEEITEAEVVEEKPASQPQVSSKINADDIEKIKAIGKKYGKSFEMCIKRYGYDKLEDVLKKDLSLIEADLMK